MPGFDGTGPLGRGSMTGRGLGPCGRRFGGRFGGRYCRVPLVLTKEDEKKILEEELSEVNLERQEIEKRLKELE